MDDVHAMGRLLDALRPWRTQLVIVGGWAHQLHRLHPLATRLPYEPLRTRDADVALSPTPPIEGDIATALEAADFHAELTSEYTPPISHYHLGSTDAGFYVEFLAPLVGSGLKRNGAPDATMTTAGVTAQKLRYLDLLLEQPWTIPLSATTKPSLTRAGQILIANPVSFVAQKILIHPMRKPDKQAQDTLYIHDKLRPTLHRNAVKELMKSLKQQYGAVTDVIRTAARMPQDRTLAPENVQAVCAYGLSEMLGE